MHNSRRNFLRHLGGALGLAGVIPFWDTTQGKALLAKLQQLEDLPIDQSITDETFWYQIKMAYTVSPALINLNNGGVCPQPRVVQEAVERYNRLSNETPSYYMWRVLDMGREPIRRKLADLAGVSPEELAINRNASEALETIIFGLRLKPGDEVVISKQAYPNMINAWKQRAHRDGIVLKWVSLDLPSEDAGYLLETFTNAFTAKTKVVHLTHMINWMGQILPVKAIAKEARKRGIEVLVDAAHSFAQLDYKIPDLECDYWGTSLHKWLCAPFGSGLLYVRKEKIANLYPLMAAAEPESTDIRKFENLGTRSFAIEQGIGQAIDFHNMIGASRKHQRLHYLKNYWANKVNALDGAEVRTSLDQKYGGAIGLLHIDGMEPIEIANILFKKHKIHTVAINWENIHGVRITPNVYTTTKDLDVLVNAIQTIVKERKNSDTSK